MKKISKIFRFRQLEYWYKKNLDKIVLLLLNIVFFTLTAIYIPFLNLFIIPSIGVGISVIIWYILFSPQTKLLVYVSLPLIGVAYFATVFGINVLLDGISELLFLITVFVLINYLREK